MCGIAGIYNSREDAARLEHVGQKMVKQIQHRGPDGNGIKVLNQKTGAKILLAHTRLSIIDLSNHAAQPMKSDDESLWIVFNGEIYNFIEIKDQLLKLGNTFHTSSDTEVILAAYQEWGLNCFEKFNGMWAIALWDAREQTFILSRDRLGKKPLFYSFVNETLFFGSEPKVIIEHNGLERKLNPQALSDYFSYRYVLGGDSFFQNVHAVEAGTHIVFKGNQKTVHRYWDLAVVSNKNESSESNIREQLESLLSSAVGLRMISDVPLGAFLSGGLDSSILVALMAKKSSIPLKTFTIGFKEAGFNEFEYAREVAELYHTDHKEILLDASQYLNSWQTMLRIKDAPLAVPNEIALHELSLVLKKDISVVLSGEGADELFGGYGRIFRSAYDYQRVMKYGAAALPVELKNSLLVKYSSLEFQGELDHFLGQYSYLNFTQKSEIFSSEFFGKLGADPNNRSFFAKLWPRLEGLDLHEKYMWVFQKIHLEGLLGRLDSATMSASVEGRAPFIDYRLIEFINAIPLHYKMKWKSKEDEIIAKNLNSNLISEQHDITKYLLRSQYQDRLPPRISSRKKVGFPVPLSQWLSGPLRDYARSVLLDPNSKTRSIFCRDTVECLLSSENHSSNAGLQVWMMVNVEDWMRTYQVSL
jgi:asparagine synthase (glutamine-hydrolysing)